MSNDSNNGAAETPLPDFDRLTRNTAIMVEEAGKIAAAYIRPREEGTAPLPSGSESSDLMRTLGEVAQSWIKDPPRAIRAQASLTAEMMTLWGTTLRKMQGEEVPPVATPESKDSRFNDPGWSQNPYFDFIKQAYLLTTKWADELVSQAEGIDEHTRHKAHFYVKQLSSAISPSNFVATNPELIRLTMEESGENLVRGMRMLGEDIAAGNGELRLRQTDTTNFAVGVNMATTPGKVILRSRLFELIQYTPTTETVRARPLLVFPPWINKYYVLDLNPEKSFIRWAVGQGFTVFLCSWVNPDERHKDDDFDSYMQNGMLAAIDAVMAETGAKSVDTLGYCVGGTLLAVTLAWLAAKGDKRVSSATLLTTQVDFTHAGDLKVFADEEQIRAVEDTMSQYGYLPAAKMAGAFNSLRPGDLIWPYVVNNYLKGKPPTAFDLLYWNADSTRLPEANHRFYLRNCYLENRLSRGTMSVGGVMLDLGKVEVPIYNLATREDHIAPARSVYVGSGKFGGPVRYVLAGSGHIAGVVNPPAKPKYQYWTGGTPTGELEDWLAKAQEAPGSWWPNWAAWLWEQDAKRIPAREPGHVLKPVGDAPGDYVKVRA